MTEIELLQQLRESAQVTLGERSLRLLEAYWGGCNLAAETLKLQPPKRNIGNDLHTQMRRHFSRQTGMPFAGHLFANIRAVTDSESQAFDCFFEIFEKATASANKPLSVRSFAVQSKAAIPPDLWRHSQAFEIVLADPSRTSTNRTPACMRVCLQGIEFIRKMILGEEMVVATCDRFARWVADQHFSSEIKVSRHWDRLLESKVFNKSNVELLDYAARSFRKLEDQ